MPMLKAVSPDVIKPGHVKGLISGPSGVGKTFFGLDFPRPYLIDTEKGATRPQYKNKLKEVNGVYFGKEEGSQNLKTVVEEVKLLATTKHDYKTLLLDSFSALYLGEAAKAEEKVGNDFGRDKKEANRPTRQLLRWLDNLDMNVWLICHRKDKWARKANGEVEYAGSTFDGYEKLEYILDLWIEVEESKGDRFFTVKKSRIDSLPKGNTYPLDYSRFAELYGKETIEKSSIPLTMATDEQIAKVTHLTEVVKIEPEEIEKWFTKADVDSWTEMTSEQIQKAIDFLEKKIQSVGNGKARTK